MLGGFQAYHRGTLSASSEANSSHLFQFLIIIILQSLLLMVETVTISLIDYHQFNPRTTAMARTLHGAEGTCLDSFPASLRVSAYRKMTGSHGIILPLTRVANGLTPGFEFHV